MAHLERRENSHSSATATPTSGYWEWPKAPLYGNMEMSICEGREACDYWDHLYQQHYSHILGMFITWGFIAGVVLIVGAVNFSRHTRKVRKSKPSKEEESATS
ncbi:hypothetical protein RUND412_011481 [Rhizina undulata]